MFHREIPLPAPFHRLELFTLVEPVQQDDAPPTLRHRLYMVDQRAEGGRVLLKDYALTPAPLSFDDGET